MIDGLQTVVINRSKQAFLLPKKIVYALYKLQELTFLGHKNHEFIYLNQFITLEERIDTSDHQ